MKFDKLTRANCRKLPAGQTLTERGITYEKLANGDGRFSVNIMVDKQRVHRVIGLESEGVTREQCEQFIEQTRTDARQNRLKLPRGRKVALGFAEAAEQYLERLRQGDGQDIDKKQERLRLHLKPFFGDKPLSQITSWDIERYKKQRMAEAAKPGTINRELAVLSHLSTKAVEWKWLEYQPVRAKRLKEDTGRIIYLTAEQVQSLLEAAAADSSAEIYPFIRIGLDTGMRRMEILSICAEHIDVDRRTIFIPHAKAGARVQPIPQELADYLKTLIDQIKIQREQNDQDKDQDQDQPLWLFPADSKSGHKVAIEKPFRRVVAAAGLDPNVVVRHTLRHTAITHLVQAGVDLPTVQRISGHKTLQMVVRYSHQNGEHLQEALDKLSTRYKTPPVDETTTVVAAANRG
jgi:integrase